MKQAEHCGYLYPVRPNSMRPSPGFQCQLVASESGSRRSQPTLNHTGEFLLELFCAGEADCSSSRVAADFTSLVASLAKGVIALSPNLMFLMPWLIRPASRWAEGPNSSKTRWKYRPFNRAGQPLAKSGYRKRSGLRRRRTFRGCCALGCRFEDAGGLLTASGHPGVEGVAHGLAVLG